jgi:hypothetical protein
MIQEKYVNGDYLKVAPTWHTEESAWKARQVLHLMAKNSIRPKTISEVGCGAGEILKQLSDQMGDNCEFWGYDISPQAIEFCKSRAGEKLHFKLADIRHERDVFFDMMLVIDVVDGVEDYYSFLREIHPKSQYKIFHIPLLFSVQQALRVKSLLKLRHDFGQIHYFNKETALQSLKDAGYEVVDYCYTNASIEQPSTTLTRNLMKLPRRVCFALNKDLAVRILGGCKLLILAK